MKIQFIKDCGHHKEGEVLECEYAPGGQYIGAGFAEVYAEPKAVVESKAESKPEPEPELEPKPEPEPVVELEPVVEEKPKPKAKKAE